MDNRPVIIIGAGGHAKVILDTARSADVPVAGLLSADLPKGAQVNGASVVGGNEMLRDNTFVTSNRFIVGVGNQSLRRRLHDELVAVDANLATLIHPTCVVSEFATIGDGSLLVAGVIVNSGARIGRSCILNTACSIDHDCTLGDLCQISPGARLAGTVRCGDDVFVGTGAIILPSISIGAGVSVGGGAVVTRDVSVGVTVVGCPAEVCTR